MYRRRRRAMNISLIAFVHKSELYFCQTIQLIHKLIDLAVGRFDFALKLDFVVRILPCRRPLVPLRHTPNRERILLCRDLSSRLKKLIGWVVVQYVDDQIQFIFLELGREPIVQKARPGPKTFVSESVGDVMWFIYEPGGPPRKYIEDEFQPIFKQALPQPTR